MIPNISRGSNPAGLFRYLFGKGRANEHRDQHLICSSNDLGDLFDLDGQPKDTFAEIGRRFDRRYQLLRERNDPYPPDRRGKKNPEREPGKDRVWHCSLAIKAGDGILTDQQWERIITRYLVGMNLIDKDGKGATWMAVRHGLSKAGNDHIHIAVQLAADQWINPWHDRVNAQATCRRMERQMPELRPIGLAAGHTRFTYQQWRQWAEWKSEHEWTGTPPWSRLDPDTRQRLINQVAANTMPKLSIGRLVEACAVASHSEDEFIRRVRREGLNIDPRMRKGVSKGTFNDPSQVIGYTITWRSKDGWTERIPATDLGLDMTLKQLRANWSHTPQAQSLTVAEWQSAMNNRPTAMRQGAERHIENLSAHDMSRLIDEAFRIQTSIDYAGGADRDQAMRQGLQTFHRLRRDYGLDGINPQLQMTEQWNPTQQKGEPGKNR
ncbi:relaxase/mobilization nuclease domain-containing protein [Bifidobacterium aemilianum]|uniref:relaxase/mobilization nuclease domain-containing protein n=1 Tax=Bifidobacterium aemilianum TaxID=2493120 RepID=UPI001F3F66C3|nr:relaxase [Bifidobacterium aemilianum]